MKGVEMTESEAIGYWRRGTKVIEDRISVTSKGDWHDAPIPLDAIEGRLWLQAQTEAYQHALEMMGVPEVFKEKSE